MRAAVGLSMLLIVMARAPESHACNTFGESRPIPELLAALARGPDPQERAVAAHVLGMRRASEAVAPLFERLEDERENELVRRAAAWALGRIRSDESTARLTKDIRSMRSGGVRAEILLALANLGGPSAIAAAKAELATDDVGEARAAAA